MGPTRRRTPHPTPSPGEWRVLRPPPSGHTRRDDGSGRTPSIIRPPGKGRAPESGDAPGEGDDEVNHAERCGLAARSAQNGAVGSTTVPSATLAALSPSRMPVWSTRPLRWATRPDEDWLDDRLRGYSASQRRPRWLSGGSQPDRTSCRRRQTHRSCSGTARQTTCCWIAGCSGSVADQRVTSTLRRIEGETNGR